MNKLIPCAIVTCLFIGGCATAESSTQPATGTKAAREETMTGSRLPRSDSNENYQGTKSMTSKDYQDYLSTLGKQSN